MLKYVRTSAPTRRAAAVGAVVALTGVMVVVPANAAADDCDGVVTDAADYELELECASDSATATTLTLDSDIELGIDDVPTYSGTANLTIDGNGYTVSQAPGATDEIDGTFLFFQADYEATLTVHDITVSGFTSGLPALVIDKGRSATIAESTFTANGFYDGEDERNSYGGAVETFAPITVTDSSFTNNSGWIGAAIFSDASAHISNSTFSHNTSVATSIYLADAAHIAGSAFVNNTSSIDAVVYIAGYYQQTSLVENSTFAQNDTRTGALNSAIGDQEGLTVRHSTFANNTGEDVHHLADWQLLEPGPAPMALNTESQDSGVFLTGNVFTGVGEVDSCLLPPTTVALYNFNSDGSCTHGNTGEGNIGGLDAGLSPLGDYGGQTLTMVPVEGSPLIDAVPTDATDLTADQRGFDRPVGDAADIGAVEVQVAVEDEDTDVDAGNVAFQVKTDAGTLYGTASPAVAVTDINWTSTANLTGAPANTALPYGAAGFTVEVPNPGDSVTITLTAPTPFTAAYKVSDGDWSTIDGATLSNDGTTVTYTLTDGGDLDEDGETNGFIVDPVALAVQATFTG